VLFDFVARVIKVLVGILRQRYKSMVWRRQRDFSNEFPIILSIIGSKTKALSQLQRVSKGYQRVVRLADSFNPIVESHEMSVIITDGCVAIPTVRKPMIRLSKLMTKATKIRPSKLWIEQDENGRRIYVSLLSRKNNRTYTFTWASEANPRRATCSFTSVPRLISDECAEALSSEHRKSPRKYLTVNFWPSFHAFVVSLSFRIGNSKEGI